MKKYILYAGVKWGRQINFIQDYTLSGYWVKRYGEYFLHTFIFFHLYDKCCSVNIKENERHGKIISGKIEPEKEGHRNVCRLWLLYHTSLPVPGISKGFFRMDSDCQRLHLWCGAAAIFLHDQWWKAKREIPETAWDGETGIYRFLRRNTASVRGGPAGYRQPVPVQTGRRRHIQALFL